MFASQRKPRFSVSLLVHAPVVLRVERELMEVLVVDRLTGEVVEQPDRAGRREALRITRGVAW